MMNKTYLLVAAAAIALICNGLNTDLAHATGGTVKVGGSCMKDSDCATYTKSYTQFITACAADCSIHRTDGHHLETITASEAYCKDLPAKYSIWQSAKKKGTYKPPGKCVNTFHTL